MAAADQFASVIDAVTEWYEKTPDEIVDLILDGASSPFAANMSETDKLAYYNAQFFLPDGSPNQAGRQQELQRLGVPAYLKALSQMQKLHGIFSPPAGLGEGV